MSTDLFDHTAAADLDNDQLAERVVGYATQIASLTARMLSHLAEFDARKAWAGEGIASCAHWLTWRAGITLRTAQEHVRMARALIALPQIAAEFAAGRLSFSKVRALTRVATPERQPELVNFARSATATQVERLCRAIRDVDAQPEPGDESAPSEAESALSESWGKWRWNADGTLSVNLRLNAADGAHLLAGLVRAEYERTRTDGDPDLPTQLPGDEGPGGAGEAPRSRADLWRNVPGNLAPAVVAMADAMIAGTPMPQVAAGAEILVHRVGEEASLDDGPALRSAEREELECGAAVRDIGHGDGDHVTVGGRRMGPVLWWGRKRRVPNAALVRTILMRDRTCQAPGCGRSRHLHIHHVKPWSCGGTTDPDNLILLCSAHHRALHHGAFSIEPLGQQRFAFRGTHGLLVHAPLHAAPPRWDPDLQVEADGVTPVGGGRCDYTYATEVIYSRWTHRARRAARDAA